MSQIIGDLILADPVILTVVTPTPVDMVVEAPAPVALVVTPPAALVVVPAQQGPQGPQGEDGPPGPAGGGSVTIVQSSPSTTWSLTHGLQRFPSITSVDTAGDQIFGDLSYLDANTARISFGAPVAGTAYLN